MDFLRFIVWFLVNFCLAKAANPFQQTVSACALQIQQKNPGFNVLVYDYPYAISTYTNSRFMASGYMTRSLMTSFVTNKAYYSNYNTNSIGSVNMVTLPNGVVFNSAHFLFEYTSYFTPLQSGLYKFQLNNVDDGAAIFLGNGAFNCCALSAKGNLPSSVDSLLTVGFLNGPQSGSTGYVYLQGGLYFPFRLVYVNIQLKAWFSFSIIQPDGTTISDYSNIVFTPDFVGDCSSTTVTQTTLFTTTISSATETAVFTSTVTQPNGATYTVQIEVVPPVTTTITSGSVSATFTSTFSNPTTTFEEVVVQIPYPTTTVGSAVPSKYTTLTTTTIGASVITEYVVITPYPTTTITSGSLTEVTSYWTTMTLDDTTFTGEVVQVPHSTTTVGSLVPSLFTTLVTTTVSGTVLTTEFVLVTPYPTTTITSGSLTEVTSYLTTMTLDDTTFTGEVVQVPEDLLVNKTVTSTAVVTGTTTKTLVSYVYGEATTEVLIIVPPWSSTSNFSKLTSTSTVGVTPAAISESLTTVTYLTHNMTITVVVPCETSLTQGARAETVTSLKTAADGGVESVVVIFVTTSSKINGATETEVTTTVTPETTHTVLISQSEQATSLLTVVFPGNQNADITTTTTSQGDNMSYNIPSSTSSYASTSFPSNMVTDEALNHKASNKLLAAVGLLSFFVLFI